MSNLTDHDKFIYKTSFDECGDERIKERFEEMINDPDWRRQVLYKINNKNPFYFYDCYVNDSDPEEGFVFEEAMLDEAIENIKEYR
jgi:hypothetical protein